MWLKLTKMGVHAAAALVAVWLVLVGLPVAKAHGVDCLASWNPTTDYFSDITNTLGTQSVRFNDKKA